MFETKSTKKHGTRTIVSLVVFVIVVVLVAVLMREPEQVGAPKLGTRGDMVPGETGPAVVE